MAKDIFAESGNKSHLDYNELSSVVATNPRLAFLQEILPKKIKVKDYLQLIKQIDEQNKNDSNDEDMDDIEDQNDSKTNETNDSNDEESDD